MSELVVITGSTGRIGKRLMEGLKGKYQVVGLDLHPPSFKSSSLSFLYTDLSDVYSIQEAFSQIQKQYGKKIASIVHLAAYYDFEGGIWEKYQSITIEGTKNILQALQAFEVEQFLFSSTLLVHKPTKPGERLQESSPLSPKWAYPKSKILTEQVIEQIKGNTPCVIFRIAGCYDEGCHSIPLSQMIHRIYQKSITSHFFPGDLSHGACYLHFEDLTHAIIKAIEQRKKLGPYEVFLIGEENTYSYQQLQNEIAERLYGKKWITLKIPKWAAKLGAWAQALVPTEEKPFIRPWMIDLADDHYEIDISHAKKMLQWSPQKDLLQVLPKMIEIFKDSPILWYREQGIPVQENIS